jgi:hypothetical protein
LFRQQFVDPLIKEMKQRGISPKDFDEYLMARHALERNAYIVSINPKMPDGGSGMTNAAAVMAKFAPRIAGFEALGKRVNAIRADNIDRMLKYGLITLDEANAWRN